MYIKHGGAHSFISIYLFQDAGTAAEWMLKKPLDKGF